MLATKRTLHDVLARRRVARELVDGRAGEAATRRRRRSTLPLSAHPLRQERLSTLPASHLRVSPVAQRSEDARNLPWCSRRHWQPIRTARAAQEETMMKTLTLILSTFVVGCSAFPPLPGPAVERVDDNDAGPGTCDAGCSSGYLCWFDDCRRECAPDAGWRCPDGYWCTFGAVCSRRDGGE